MGRCAHMAAHQRSRYMRHVTRTSRDHLVMEHRFLQGIGTSVSALGAGCWTIGGPATNRGVPIGWDGVDEERAFRGLIRARELGVTLFDTADVYGLGRSERLLGRLLQQEQRTALVISGKVGYFAGTAPHPYTAIQMSHQLHTTLANLGTDYLDLYSFHSNDFGPQDRYLDGAIEQMEVFRRQGLIRAIGLRAPHEFAEEWAAEGTLDPRSPQATRFLDLFSRIRPDVVVARYNLLSPLYHSQETDIFAFARLHRVGVIIKQALGQGVLMGTHHPDAARVFGKGDHRSQDPAFHPDVLRAVHHGLQPVRTHFGATPSSLARVALRYALQHAPDSPVLVGFRDADQIQTTLTCLGAPLSHEEIVLVRHLLAPPRDALHAADTIRRPSQCPPTA